MSGRLLKPGRLSYADKMTRLKTRLQDPEWRRYFALIAIGKAVGVGRGPSRDLLHHELHALRNHLGAAGGTGCFCSDDASRCGRGDGTSSRACNHHAGDAFRSVGHHQEPGDQPHQHDVDVGGGIPGVRDAGRFHDARSGLLPLT